MALNIVYIILLSQYTFCCDKPKIAQLNDIYKWLSILYISNNIDKMLTKKEDVIVLENKKNDQKNNENKKSSKKLSLKKK